jgi:hypothetical protein
MEVSSSSDEDPMWATRMSPRIHQETAMSAIQGLSPATAPSFPSSVASKPLSAPIPSTPKLEVNETAQSKRQEALSGRQEVGEGGAQVVGSKFSAIA